MPIVDLPISRYSWGSHSWRLEGSTPFAPGVTGAAGTGFIENRVWMASLAINAARGDNTFWFEAFFDRVRGRSGSVRVELDGRQHIAQLPQQSTDPVTFDSDVTFDLGVTFAPAQIVLSLTDAAPAGATFVRMNVVSRFVSYGTMIGLPNDRVYRVASVEDGRVYINPPLREAVAAGTEVELERPTVRMRLTDDGAGVTRMPTRLMGAFALDLVEDLRR